MPPILLDLYVLTSATTMEGIHILVNTEDLPYASMVISGHLFISYVFFTLVLPIDMCSGVKARVA